MQKKKKKKNQKTDRIYFLTSTPDFKNITANYE